MEERAFLWVPGYKTDDRELPKRQTRAAAGYDLAAYDEIILPPNRITLVPTGVCVRMPENEFLAIYPRSSLAIKHHVMLANGVGIIDADYYGNANNHGHIMVPLWNLSQHTVLIHQGERIAQGIFQCYQKVTTESPIEKERSSGFGSTDESV